MKILMTALVFLLTTNLAQARNLQGRLGLGFTNQYRNDVPAISFKLQKSKAFAFGPVIGVKMDDQNGRTAIGFKVFRLLFDEPQLNFYAAALAGLLKTKVNGTSNSGYQFDATLGSEFHFTGIESLGFSLEFGVSVNKTTSDTVIETIGDHMITAAVHFYL